jgi:hypothetical protein
MRALAFLAVCQAAFGAAFSVPGDFATIQEACDAAGDSDRLAPADGYVELAIPRAVDHVEGTGSRRETPGPEPGIRSSLTKWCRRFTIAPPLATVMPRIVHCRIAYASFLTRGF